MGQEILSCSFDNSIKGQTIQRNEYNLEIWSLRSNRVVQNIRKRVDIMKQYTYVPMKINVDLGLKVKYSYILS
jgi:hypothetical protein